MTSRPAPTGCFVYITLPGATEAVTAARFELTTSRGGFPLGRLVYGKSYLARGDAVAFDPVELALGPRVYETTMMKGVFGALRDASPDSWGRRVIERHAGKSPLSELDYLLESPDDRAGALSFGLSQQPPAPRRKFNQTILLAKLQAKADAIVNDEELPADPEVTQAGELLLEGTSMGGARPKAVVENDEGLWIAKFNRSDDRWNYARIEHAMLMLARACGLTTAESRVVSIGARDVLLVKRFDRGKTEAGYQRARMVSALAAEDGRFSPAYGQVVLRRACRRVAPGERRSEEGRHRAVPPDVLQRHHLQYRRPSTQSRNHCQKPRLETLARL